MIRISPWVHHSCNLFHVDENDGSAILHLTLAVALFIIPFQLSSPYIYIYTDSQIDKPKNDAIYDTIHNTLLCYKDSILHLLNVLHLHEWQNQHQHVCIFTVEILYCSMYKYIWTPIIIIITHTRYLKLHHAEKMFT